jgi:hypothetical protein
VAQLYAIHEKMNVGALFLPIEQLGEVLLELRLQLLRRPDDRRFAWLGERSESHAIGGESLAHETRTDALGGCVVVVKGCDKCAHVLLRC